MSKTLVAMTSPAGVTTVSRDGTPYRGDPWGIVYLLQAHQTEMQSRGLGTATNAQLAAGGHAGHATQITGENARDHG